MTDQAPKANTTKPKKRRPGATGSMTLNKDGTMTIRLNSRGSGIDLRKLLGSGK